MNQNGAKAQSSESTYYTLLGLHPSASVIDIRRAYRDLSKLYHPDTTELPGAIAKRKFQEINEAYATLSSPDRRLNYDLKIGYSRFGVIQAPPDLHQPVYTYDMSKSAYLDASDRPLSPGEIFALFIMAITIIGCLVLAIAIAVLRGDSWQPQTVSFYLEKLSYFLVGNG
ncbi:J domain-containing protein [Calothrix sp. 336/3]|uniref:J domain-containing protein n=1 Tax=Calothrix sp. 336/3 TaxID=1337936 RepID=UPI0004E2F6EE|nr:J domain-containing protein [Calothrix sp. 336/3]AKG21934.1 molecular chaperone DnaJ [Calothrix sp. 336/3]